MKLLRVARLVLGIPVSTLAARAGVSVRELARIERGEVQPKTATLAALDSAFMDVLRSRLVGAEDVAR